VTNNLINSTTMLTEILSLLSRV